MGDKNGAMVAMDPHTGEILAMVSRPTFDPNDFAVRISRGEWNKLVTDPDKPLLNKAIQAQLAPGLDLQDPHVGGGLAGRHRPDSERALQWRRDVLWPPVRLLGEKPDHGAVDLTKAIYQSCDVFFYTLAEKLGIDRIAKYATMHGPGPEDRHRSCRKKPAASCRRKNGRSATSSRNGMPARPFQSASDRARWLPRRCN